MKDFIQLKENYIDIATDSNITLEDEKTKWIIKADLPCQKIVIDKGMFKDSDEGIKKCDYGVSDVVNQWLGLIELKGSVIEKAYIQLLETIKKLDELDGGEIPVWKNTHCCVYIVSSGHQQIPKNISSHARELAKKLSRHNCSTRTADIFGQITYVKIIKKRSKTLYNKSEYCLICSNAEPAKLSWIERISLS